MYDRMLVHALLFNRPNDWTIERSVQVFDSHPVPVSLFQVFLACL